MLYAFLAVKLANFAMLFIHIALPNDEIEMAGRRTAPDGVEYLFVRLVDSYH